MTDDNAEIFRAQNLEPHLTSELTGQEIAEIRLQHEAVVRLMSLEQISEHILQLRKLMASLRVKDQSAREVRAAKQQALMSTFTEEQKADFLKLARQGKDPLKAKPPKEPKEISGSKAAKRRERAITLLMHAGVSRADAEKAVGN